MKRKLTCMILVLFFFLAAHSLSFASGAISLQWDPNSESDLAGYRVYYQMDSSASPFSGSGALEGTAPIDVKNQTTATVSGLEAGHTYYFAVTAYNTAGQESTYSNVISGTIPLSDTSAPSITSFSIPATSSALTVPVTSLSASDNSGVTGYLLTESASTLPSLGAAGWTVAPPASYTFSGAGLRSLYAWARDAAGNVSNAVGRSVTITLPLESVSLEAASPVLSITFPAADSLVSGTVKVGVESPSTLQLSRVLFYLDGSLKAADTKSPYFFNWNSRTVVNGSHTLLVKALDAAGNVLQASIPVTVQN